MVGILYPPLEVNIRLLVWAISIQMMVICVFKSFLRQALSGFKAKSYLSMAHRNKLDA